MAGGTFLLAVAACALTRATELNLSDRDVHVGDVVVGSCASDAANAVIARLPAGGRRTTLTHAALASLVHRRAPQLTHLEIGDAGATVALTHSVTAISDPDGGCYAAARALPTGHALSREDLQPAGCTHDPSSSLTYDATNDVLRSTQTIAAGAYLGRILVSPTPFVDEGGELSIVVTVGPVRIERTVTALQPAAGGDAVFVRDRDGHVFRAPPLAGSAP